jgi:Coenzyme PQQ synthesis protein D (PqqD)
MAAVTRRVKIRAETSRTSSEGAGPASHVVSGSHPTLSAGQPYLLPHPHVLSQRGADAIILLSLANGCYYTVEGVAAREWELFDGTRTQHEVGVEISREYDVPLDQVEADLAELIDDLDSEELLAPRG